MRDDRRGKGLDKIYDSTISSGACRRRKPVAGVIGGTEIDTARLREEIVMADQDSEEDVVIPLAKGNEKANTTYSDVLRHIGQVVLIAAIGTLMLASGYTTFEGFQSFLPFEMSIFAAFGLQGTLFATEIFFAHLKTFRARFISVVTMILVMSLSITFSYIGLRAIFTRHVAERRDPIYEREDFRQKREALQQRAAEIRGAALEYLGEDELDLQAQASIAEAKKTTREQIANSLRSRIAHNEYYRVNPRETARLRRQLDLAQATADSLRIEAEKLRAKKGQSGSRKSPFTDYKPNVLGVQDNDWETLGHKYQELAALWGTMPEEFKRERALGPAPTKAVLRNGKIAEGQDHPTIEALASIRRPEPHETFALSLAGILDLIPFVALWMTRDKKVPLHRRLSSMRRWMKEMRVQTEMMDGILGWAWGVFTGFFFRRAATSDDPRVLAFQKFLTELRVEMEDFLQSATLPTGVSQLLKLRLMNLYTQANVTAFEAGRKLNTLAMQTYESCLDAIEQDGLDEHTKLRLRDFLGRHMEKYEDAVKAHSYDEEENTRTRKRR